MTPVHFPGSALNAGCLTAILVSPNSAFRTPHSAFCPPVPFTAPHPGSQSMPRWDTGQLIDAPRITWRTALALVGPGIVMSASAIGGGEWLLGPTVTAKYGGTLMWLAGLSILFQALYNLEICR